MAERDARDEAEALPVTSWQDVAWRVEVGGCLPAISAGETGKARIAQRSGDRGLPLRRISRSVSWVPPQTCHAQRRALQLPDARLLAEVRPRKSFQELLGALHFADLQQASRAPARKPFDLDGVSRQCLEVAADGLLGHRRPGFFAWAEGGLDARAS